MFFFVVEGKTFIHPRRQLFAIGAILNEIVALIKTSRLEFLVAAEKKLYV
jgi:hypothetical protein